MSSTTEVPRRGGRYTHAEAILGPELCGRLADTKVLLVGAGGIGCELLKNVVLTGFGHITLLDLDTIDLSNLNRQFLFRKKDIKQSKAMVAAQTAGAFNPNVHIYPIHANIKEPQFDIEWFRGFDIVLNALDNLDARRHVNKMCMAAGIPLVESGTAGYLGQVQPLLKDRTECFDCVLKPTPKSFPVCTIRSTPSQPIHCIVWAKSYLLPQLFGEDEDGTTELDDAEKQGENGGQEIAALRKEALAYRAVRKALRAAETTHDAAKTVFQKVFHSDILNLLSMSDMWRSRAPPTPLDFHAIENHSFVIQEPSKSHTATGGVNGRSSGKPAANGHVNGNAASAPIQQRNGTNAGLKDQRALSLQDNLALFVSSTNRLAARLRAGEETISFDKDDDDTLDFVTAASNLRSAAYYIERKTRWEVKEMAGNIIPAIATTNAIISGLIVLQALHILRKSYGALKIVHLQFKPSVPLGTVNLCPPNPKCAICRDTYTTVLCDPTNVTLGEIIDGILGDGNGEHGGTGRREVSVYEDKRVLSDPDWDDNLERTLESLNVTRGKFLTIVDEEGEWGDIAVALSVLPPNRPADGPSLILPSPLPKPTHTPRRTSPAPTVSRKRSAPDDDIEESEPLSKRPRINGAITVPQMGSPSKKRRLEDEGLVMLSGATDEVDDEVIVID
ncbi:hypothetical protein PISMIDRAFT_676289 [Pisolithus microcarpus 441]|uniref:Ubiquitin-activating enzyme E1-like n=1 Tax=Pisolithus microcarpus 441 TaxID=765257 RepID=A0A0C9YMC8_9AGAM|nr:hypothetical protein PISMIDRAFT_676289 [Pisolithus microcarpus 441]